MPNRLADATSPYLLQHQENPVDWRPWCSEALERAREEDRPIFLSIGYSACHWCHVMAHESFEDEEVARVLNEHFVPIKVDREERPDLDQIYMEAVMALTGHGGWPMSVFLTPDLEPFFGGTYWPPRQRGGMPGFLQILGAVVDAWKNRREELNRQAGELAGAIRQGLSTHATPGSQQVPDEEPLAAAEAALARSFDPQYGGFGPAPKFPHAMDLRLLLRRWHRSRRDHLLHIVTTTLDRMAAGGIYDHLGGGFHRYSVDDRWLVPHFEKMLYDNALLPLAYLEAWQATGRDAYARVVRETLDYLLRDMTDAAGGLYSAEDADSEGVEGKFYVWSPDEVESVLGPEKARTFCYVYDVTPEGNFEGRSILNRPKTPAQCAKMLSRDEAALRAELAESRAKLLEVRSRRARPGRDDKVLASWNGLAIEAMAACGAALGEARYVEAASRAADFILDNMRREDGRLLHTWRRGRAALPAYLEDYAALACGLAALYEASFDERRIDEAVALGEAILEHFGDAEAGGFFFTAADHERLIARRKDWLDASVPSSIGLATTALVRLGKLCGRGDFLQAADRALAAAAPLFDRAPQGMGQMLLALDVRLGPAPEIVLLGSADATRATLAELHRRFVPNKLLACRQGNGQAVRSPHLGPLFEGKRTAGAEPTVFVCEDFTCARPVAGGEAAVAAWDELAGGAR